MIAELLKSLTGDVWIPGVMAGMLVSGASPVYAGIFQFIIVAMILAASGIAGLVATVLMPTRTFSKAEQLKSTARQPMRSTASTVCATGFYRHEGNERERREDFNNSTFGAQPRCSRRTDFANPQKEDKS